MQTQIHTHKTCLRLLLITCVEYEQNVVPGQVQNTHFHPTLNITICVQIET